MVVTQQNYSSTIHPHVRIKIDITDTFPGLLYSRAKHVYLQTNNISFSTVFKKARSSKALGSDSLATKQNCTKCMADPGGGRLLYIMLLFPH